MKKEETQEAAKLVQLLAQQVPIWFMSSECTSIMSQLCEQKEEKKEGEGS